ncbi:hypothetical protein Q3G72_015801 [Acer saccharum]|nr:hypothetical protein Q3G72_015801 [Acer saccharum]
MSTFIVLEGTRDVTPTVLKVFNRLRRRSGGVSGSLSVGGYWFSVGFWFMKQTSFSRYCMFFLLALQLKLLLHFQLPRLAHQTTVKALETGASLSVAIRRIEEAFLQNMKCNCCKIIVSCSDSKSTLNMHHCCRLPKTEWTRGLVI